MFPYSDKLQKFAAWFAQLWAESLGKKNKAGDRFGSTPIQALGATDQHSQLQLYIDGPKDKFFTFIEVCDHADFPVADLGIDHLKYNDLKGRNLKDLLKAELDATHQTLSKHYLPQRLITISIVNSYYLGQLMINAVLETLYVAKIWDVNPFDQPAVEEGKILAMKFLNG
jgi:glucose-6-phosphate isomerase